MIKIEKEPPEFFENLKVYECCYFCNKKTDTWNFATNQPVCIDCSEYFNQSDLPKAHPDYEPKKKK